MQAFTPEQRDQILAESFEVIQEILGTDLLEATDRKRAEAFLRRAILTMNQAAAKGDLEEIEQLGRLLGFVAGSYGVVIKRGAETLWANRLRAVVMLIQRLAPSLLAL